MKQLRTAHVAFLCTLILTQFLALAQPTSSAHAQTKTYRVEIVVFKNLGPDSSGGEIWHRVSSKYASSIDGLVNTKNNLSRVKRYVQYIELRNLSSIVQKLESDPQYSVLSNRAWLQPLFRKSTSVHVPLGNATALYTPNSSSIPAFSGFLQLFENRLLFVDLDLKVRVPRSLDSGNDAYGSQSNVIYSIREKRRVKLNEVHYFDHPYFGAIVRVSRLSG